MRPLFMALVPVFMTASGSLPPAFPDDLDKRSLLAALDTQDKYLAKTKRKDLPFGAARVSIEKLRATHEAFKKLVRAHYGTPEFDRALNAEFDLVSAGSTHFTSYYQPLLKARHAPDADYRFPLYRRPPDLMDGQPYLTHSEIEAGGLSGRGLEVAWVKSEFDRYILMVQGSGMLKFSDGKTSCANYDGKNGRAYSSLGKMLINDGAISAAKVSIPAIRDYFDKNPDKERGYLLRNASYVFFRLEADGPFGVDGIPLTAGRSIATDKAYWPSGAIGYVKYPRPRLDESFKPISWSEGARFVLDQDTGGAIKGLGRVDLYQGAGPEAAAIAGVTNATGSLAFLMVK